MKKKGGGIKTYFLKEWKIMNENVMNIYCAWVVTVSLGEY